MSAIKAFFHQLLSVGGQLQEMFPDDPDFPTLITFLTLLQNTNPTLVLKTFYDNVIVLYEKEIDAKNELFITEYKADDESIDIVLKVQRYWSVVSQQTKDSLWQYMYVLKELCKRAYTVPT
jgi:hypothetical protein